MTKKFEIPRVLSNDLIEDDNYQACYDAARKHGKQLDKAHDDLMVAWDTAMVLKGYLNETHISECMRAATLVGQMEKRIEKAYERIDRHNARHNNLFIAYFDQQAAGGAK